MLNLSGLVAAVLTAILVVQASCSNDAANSSNSKNRSATASADDPKQEPGTDDTPSNVNNGVDSPSSTPKDPPGNKPGDAPKASLSCKDAAYKRLVPVKTTEELQAALSDATPGDLIELADGTYQGLFEADVSAKEESPIFLCGGKDAILEGPGVKKSGYVLYLNKASYWRVVGITVRNGQKGIMTSETNGAILDGVTVHNVGHEAVHFRNNSSNNILQNSLIYDTGKANAGFGEGVYIGTATSNAHDDKSDNNKILRNKIGPGVSAEGIDAKEYSSGGLIEGNIVDGTGQLGKNFAVSNIFIKGNDYVVRGNTCKNPLEVGLKNYTVDDARKGSSGNGNLFEQNTIENASKLGIHIVSGDNNTVKCDNIVSGEADKYSNVTCTP